MMLIIRLRSVQQPAALAGFIRYTNRVIFSISPLGGSAFATVIFSIIISALPVPFRWAFRLCFCNPALRHAQDEGCYYYSIKELTLVNPGGVNELLKALNKFLKGFAEFSWAGIKIGDPDMPLIKNQTAARYHLRQQSLVFIF
jgi:hypothetical protein